MITMAVLVYEIWRAWPLTLLNPTHGEDVGCRGGDSKCGRTQYGFVDRVRWQLLT